MQNERKFMSRKGKIMQRVLWGMGLLLVGILTLNLFLTGRLERYLKTELIRRTADATDGFYRLSFDDLDISFFNGELNIQGIRLIPDSAVFHRWQAIDSLPSTYVETEIAFIDFKGINLTWRWNFKKLHFNSFAIKAPDIRIFNAYHSNRSLKEDRNIKTKTLYELIAPYINELSVKTLNLENASVSYIVENPLTPIVYGLQNVSFHAYGFRVDSTSSLRGKLLYSDNFDFITNQRQTLLTNNDFLLQTDSIRLSTEDSVIYIRNIVLDSQEKLWSEKKQKPDKYANGKIAAVEVKGIQFERKEGLNYLQARSFDIRSSGIQAFNLSGGEAGKQRRTSDNTHKAETDSLIQSLSLYDLISPVLHEVAISHISVEKTKLDYSLAVKDSVEVYKLDNLDFYTDDFRIDSMSAFRHGLGYSKNIRIEATGIEGLMTARNHTLSIARLSLDTEKKSLRVTDIRLRPLSVRSYKDYISGHIHTISIEGLAYDKGISANRFAIESPVVRYVRANRGSGEAISINSQVDVVGLLNPFLEYLSIRRISLNRANLRFDDKTEQQPAVYTLNDFDFFATNFLVNEDTGKETDLFFQFEDVGFSFHHFDNVLPGRKSRLSMKEGRFSTLDGTLLLKDVRLIPQEQTGEKAPDKSIGLSVPLIRMEGFDYLVQSPSVTLKAATFYLDSPDVHIQRANRPEEDIHATVRRLGLNNLSWTITDWKQVLTAPDSTVYAGKKPDLYRMLARYAENISLGKLDIADANATYAFRRKDSVLVKQQLDTTDFSVEGLSVHTSKRMFSLNSIRLNTRNIDIPLDNGFYKLKVGSFVMDEKQFRLDQLHLVSPYPKMEFAYRQPKHQDWFDVSVGSLVLDGMDLPAYFSDNRLNIGRMQIDNVVLQNFKNKQIDVPLRWMPMVYEALQKAPVKLFVDTMSINNLSVIYEELAKNGTHPGRLFFTDMNGRFTGFTNVVSHPEQYIRLDANGKLMGKGSFAATWMLPVDSLNDRFLLNAHLGAFDLTLLNEIVTPLAPAKIEKGWLDDLTFSMDASSQGGTIEMLFLYNGMKATILKEKNGLVTNNTFVTRLANLLLKEANPDHSNKGPKKPRSVHMYVERDPYHSTFNYLWQMLRPAAAASVGISGKEQAVARKTMTVISRIKSFLGIGKKPEKQGIDTDTFPIE